MTDNLRSNGIFVIFGLTGDLAHRKLLPALYQLLLMGLLADDFRILGVTRRDVDMGHLRELVRSTVAERDGEIEEAVFDRLFASIELVHMNITHIEDYSKLKSAIISAEASIGTPVNRLYYLAVPPKMFEPIVNGLAGYGLNTNNDIENRLLIEKPFGYNTATAQELIDITERHFSEQAIYRVDHYLAKETAQNILTFRFNNPLFKSVWDSSSVDFITITASETISIEGRVEFYESTGALRDLIQSHLLQLLALTAMEEPRDRSSAAIHEAKLKLLDSIKQIPSEQVAARTVRGQYEGYRQDVENQDTTTETYAAIQLEIDNDRWRGVPILLRTGKAMAEKVTEITLVFASKDNPSERNALTMRIQPNEGIVLSLLAKKPSLQNETELVQMEFFYNESFYGKQPEAYERVLIDAIRGDKTLFTTDKEVLSSWRIIENVLDNWAQQKDQPVTYKCGTWGPDSADGLAQRANASWLTGVLRVYSRSV